MQKLKSLYQHFISTEQYLDLSCVREAWNEINTCLSWTEKELGRIVYSRIEDAIVTALTAQEQTGFIVGYLYAQPQAEAKLIGGNDSE